MPSPDIRIIDNVMRVRRDTLWERIQKNALFYSGLLVLVGIPAWVISLLFSSSIARLRRRWRVLLASLTVPFMVVAWSHIWSRSDGFSEFLIAWQGAGLIAVPLARVVMSFKKKILSLFTEPSITQAVEEEREREEYEQMQLSYWAQELAASTQPPEQGNTIALGVVEQRDNLPTDAPVFYENDWLFLKEKVLTEHMFILGSTGAGKTEFLKRLIFEVLEGSERDIYIIDGKGEKPFAYDIANLIHQHRGQQVPIFAYPNTNRPEGSVYDAIRGNSDDVVEQLLSLIGADEMEGNAAYYRDFNTDVLQLICGLGRADIEPPHSFEQLRERASLSWLRKHYGDDPNERDDLNAISDKDLEGFRRRIRHLARAFIPYIDPSGFNLHDSRGAVFSIDTLSKPITAKTFMSFFITGVKNWITSEKDPERPALLLIDEFQAFGNKNITALLSQARTKNLGVILATQNTAGLGDEEVLGQILGNSVVKIIMRNDDAEELAKLAGTKKHLNMTIQGKDGDPTGMNSARFEDIFKVHPNDVAQLRKGEFYAVYNRWVTKAYGRMVGEIHTDPDAIALFEKPNNSVAVTQPPPSPTPQKQPQPETEPQLSPPQAVIEQVIFSAKDQEMPEQEKGEEPDLINFDDFEPREI